MTFLIYDFSPLFFFKHKEFWKSDVTNHNTSVWKSEQCNHRKVEPWGKKKENYSIYGIKGKKLAVDTVIAEGWRQYC